MRWPSICIIWNKLPVLLSHFSETIPCMEPCLDAWFHKLKALPPPPTHTLGQHNCLISSSYVI